MIDPSIKIPEIKAGFDAMSYFKDMTEKNKLASEYGFTTVACSGPFSLEGLLLNFKNKTNFIAIWKSHATLTLLAKQDCPLWLQYD